MNIALIGAPGSGKSDLAEQLADRLKDRGKVAVIDNYAAEVEEKTQIALGPFGDYLGNLYVALERYARERNARLHNDIVITCGTFLETAVYMATHFIALANTLSDAEKVEAAPRMEAVLRILGVLYIDICDYDQGLYLPPPADDADAAFMDEQLQSGLENFKKTPVTRLTGEDRLADAVAALEPSEVQST